MFPVDALETLQNTPKVLASTLTTLLKSRKQFCYGSLSIAAYMYSIWVLACVVAWVSHLGERVPLLSPALAHGGHPSTNPSVDGIIPFFMHNIPLALVFVLPHSLLRVPLLHKVIGMQYARLVYSTISSVALHIFMYNFRPLETEVLFTMPFGTRNHAILSVVMLVYAFVVMLADWRTHHILGITRALNKNCNFPKSLTPRMDIITWMGFTTWNAGGAVAFILFSGLSILPEHVRWTDVIVRVVAAIYLRARSQGFRSWVNNIDSVHHATWIIRGIVLIVAAVKSDAIASAASSTDALMHTAKALGAAVVLALVLTFFEKVKFVSFKRLVQSDNKDSRK